MMKGKIYKVTLEPKDWFFFGGNTTFDNGVKTSYIAHSTLFPQQTALLGMIRYQLLKQNDLLFGQGGSSDSINVKDLIGENSFSMNESGQTFGDILGLSPVYIEEYQDDDNKCFVRELFPMALTNSYDLSFDNDVRIYMTAREKTKLINDHDSYEPKQYSNYMMMTDKNGGSLSIESIFETRMQVGITKNTDHRPKEGEKEQNFFKHEMVRFRKDKKKNTTFRYAFYVQLENYELSRDYVFLGAERSCFDMEVCEIKGENDLKKLYLLGHPASQEQGKIEILSPAYVKELDKLNDLCDFHWSFLIPFRNLTFVKNGQGRLNSGNVSYNRGETCYNMLSAGSVLFFDEANKEKIEILLNNEHLQLIGYNYFDSMNNKKTE